MNIKHAYRKISRGLDWGMIAIVKMEGCRIGWKQSDQRIFFLEEEREAEMQSQATSEGWSIIGA